MLKIIDLHTAVAEPMEKGRGSKIKLVNTTLGTESLDVHLNRRAVREAACTSTAKPTMSISYAADRANSPPTVSFIRSARIR